jgi:rod shape-determining protein MreC
MDTAAMPPPERGRPGFSRRAQYGIFSGYVVAVLGALGGLVLLAISVADPASFAFLRRGAAEVAAPVGAVGAASRGAGHGLFAEVAAYIRAGSQNAGLRREVEAARVQQVRMQGVLAENRRLKALLGVVDAGTRPVAATRLIGSTSASTRRFAILGAGARHGVRPRMPVRSAIGLVGRVLEVGPSTARVLLVTDSENVVPVRRASDGIAAFSQGRADGRLVLRLIDMGVNPLKRGDVFVTSGSGGIYPPNIPVAVVESLTPDGAVARIVSDPAAAEVVIVEPMYQDLRPPSPARTVPDTPPAAGPHAAGGPR